VRIEAEALCFRLTGDGWTAEATVPELYNRAFAIVDATNSGETSVNALSRVLSTSGLPATTVDKVSDAEVGGGTDGAHPMSDREPRKFSTKGVQARILRSSCIIGACSVRQRCEIHLFNHELHQYISGLG
jgi:hypothetical protein